MGTPDPFLPAYYTRLEPFRDLFASGFPIVTYHKFGAAPRGARLRGMHLPTGLLERQLREWTAAGYGAAAVGESGTWTPGDRRLALTIDDGFRSVHEGALPLLSRHRFPAVVYLVAERLGGRNDWEIAQGEIEAPLMTAGEVREWLAAGNTIGSHTLTHPWLTRLPLERAREEIGASRRRLEDLFDVPVRDFCYPYGDWNPAIRDLVGGSRLSDGHDDRFRGESGGGGSAGATPGDGTVRFARLALAEGVVAAAGEKGDG
jgi:peptidoglycan/xylan/chitin deacetylase (PgdA/CDA1 family)